jgi:hypothetical protein
MSPAFFTKVATRLFVYRWGFLAASVIGFAALAVALALGAPPVAHVAIALAGPLIFVPWAALCACTWFHPERGNLQPGSKFVGRMPHPVQSAIRWYAAIFLLIFTVAAVVWPVMSWQ